MLCIGKFQPDGFDDLCDDCQKCAKACHGKALEITENGPYQLDTWQCATYLAGASALKNPFLGPDALQEITDRMAILRGEKKLTPDEAKVKAMFRK